MGQDGRTRQEIRQAARTVLGIDSLWPAQEEAIAAVVAGRDTLAVLPTGSGKSAIYQVSATLIPGPTVVVSPLIALQKDQTDALADLEAGDAALINSTLSATRREALLEEAAEGALEFIFLTPEQLADQRILQRLREAGPTLFVIDEAHCITEWGHDFRPDYLLLGPVIEALGHPTVLALTATAPEATREEIIDRLDMRDPLVITLGIDRPNIWLGVDRFDDEHAKRQALIEALQDEPKPGIVYVATRRAAEDLHQALLEAGLDSDFYHAGLPDKRRAGVQDAFMRGELDVIVATRAFGLGLDKADVRFVYHYEISDSLESYYQEIGRAGRDGEPARALLFYDPADLGLHRFFAAGRIKSEDVAKTLTAVERAHGADVKQLAAVTGLSAHRLQRIINYLSDAGGVRLDARGRWRSTAGRRPGEQIDDIDEAQHQRHAYLQSRIDMIRRYAETTDCRRRDLLAYFGEALAPCGNCDNCQSGTLRDDVEVEDEDVMVEHAVWGRGRFISREGTRAVLLFDQVGYKTLDLDAVEQRDLLKSPDPP